MLAAARRAGRRLARGARGGEPSARGDDDIGRAAAGSDFKSRLERGRLCALVRGAFAQRVEPVALGLWAGYRAPRWLEGSRLRELLDPPAEVGEGAICAEGEHDPAVRRGRLAARTAVWLLGRAPGPARNTCLYRSIAEAEVLRRYGIPAVVRLGFAPADGVADNPSGHAWIELPDKGPLDQAATNSAGRYQPVTPARENRP